MKIQIICSSPGMWRNGVQHPASEFYPADRWSEKELERFRADPAFTVREVDETAENTMTDADFLLREPPEGEETGGEQLTDVTETETPSRSRRSKGDK